MILFYDTETTGWVHGSKPLDDPKQPHMVQLAAQLVTPDDETVMEFSTIIDPGIDQGVHIPSKVVEVHGIDDAKAKKFGVSPATAVDFFMHFAGFASLAVCHSVAYDSKVIEIARARRHAAVQPPLTLPTLCTLATAKKALPGPHNLAALTLALFGAELKNAHTAMADTVACRRVYFELKARGIV